jgi:hypothetical protein
VESLSSYDEYQIGIDSYWTVTCFQYSLSTLLREDHHYYYFEFFRKCLDGISFGHVEYLPLVSKGAIHATCIFGLIRLAEVQYDLTSIAVGRLK